MKHRMIVARYIPVSPGQLTYLTKVDTVLRYEMLRRTTLECRSRVSVMQLKIVYKLVKWVAFSCTLFGGQDYYYKNIIECKTVQETS